MYYARTPATTCHNVLLNEWIDYICVKDGLLLINNIDFVSHLATIKRQFAGIYLNNIEFIKSYKNELLFHINNAIKYKKVHPIFPDIRKELLKQMKKEVEKIEIYLNKASIDLDNDFISDQYNEAYMTKQLLENFINKDIITDPVQADAQLLSMKNLLNSIPSQITRQY